MLSSEGEEGKDADGESTEGGGGGSASNAHQVVVERSGVAVELDDVVLLLLGLRCSDKVVDAGKSKSSHRAFGDGGHFGLGSVGGEGGGLGPGEGVRVGGEFGIGFGFGFGFEGVVVDGAGVAEDFDQVVDDLETDVTLVGQILSFFESCLGIDERGPCCIPRED